MSFSINFPLFLIVASLFSSVFSILLKPQWARRLTLALTGCATVLNAVLFVYLNQTQEVILYLMGHFSHPWGNELRLTVIEALVVTVLSGVLFFTVLGGKQGIDEFIPMNNKKHIFYIMCDLIQASMIALAYTNDIFTGYVFVEILTLSSAGILVARDNGRTVAAATRYMIYALVGSGLFLFGIVFLYNITGHLLMPELKETIASLYASGQYKLPLVASLCLMFIGLAIKSGLFPFHFWMADTYGEAIPATSGILSGVVSKLYIFLLMKIIFDVYGTDFFYGIEINKVSFVLGACGIVIGSYSAIRENNIYRMCAYSSAAQIGYIYLGIGLSPTLGFIAAIYQILAHALTKPPVFLATYRISRVSGNAKQFRNLSGAATLDPFSGIAFTFEALSMVGIPLTMGFISKYLFASAVFEYSHVMIIITLLVLAVSTILNTLYFTRTIIRIFSARNDRPITWVIDQPQLAYVISAVVFMVMNIMLGVSASSVTSLIEAGLNLF